ncbi:MAG: YceH family protein [Sphaerotilus sp.]|nr:YceH family protein [Sphaerotilus sp.]
MRRNLTPLEARIVAVLVEKEATVRDSYPLSLNALCAGCNQKTAREPVMNLGDAEVLATIEELKALNLVNEVSGARVVRYEHNLARVLGVPGAAAALLTMLVLRGPQTAAELRLHCERLHRFADVSSVEGFLDELAEKSPSRVRKLPRASGARESRWAHLLCGDAGLESLANESASASASTVDAGLAEDVAVLRAEVAELRGQLGRLAAALGADLG